MKTKFGKTIAGVALLFCAYGAGGCHGDLDIMQDNKLSASNMWKEESDATSATYGLYVYLRSALKSMNDVYLCWGELRNGTLSNHGDLEIIGNQSPRYQYSINMSLNWNGIGLSMLWQGVGKRDWYPWTESGFFWGKWNRAYNSLMKTQTGDNVVRIDKSTDNWRVTNMDKNPYWTRMVSLAANRNDGPLTWENDHYLQDASYIRLKNITIDYTFPKHICKKLRLEGLKVYLSGENLFTHSPMFKHTDMFDPEVITSGDSDFAASTTSGLNGTGNGYSYPMLKTVTLGINVTF